MKRVFSSHSEVCHVWASQSQDTGSAGNVYFDGATIYSYGRHFPMAKFQKMPNGRTVVLFETGGYSNSTSHHQSLARQSLSGLDVTVFHMPSAFWRSYIDGKAYLLGKIAETMQLSKRASVNAHAHVRGAQAYITRLGMWGVLRSDGDLIGLLSV